MGFGLQVEAIGSEEALRHEDDGSRTGRVIIKDYRVFWIRHKRDIDHTYTLNKGTVSAGFTGGDEVGAWLGRGSQLRFVESVD
jgi:hypothetical protein